MPFLTFVAVGNRSIPVLEIQDALTSDSHYNFSMTVFLDTQDKDFVLENSLSIATQIFDLYSMARPNPTQRVTWVQENFQEPTDLPFPTDTVMVVEWESSHPFHITEAGEDGNGTWQGADPEGIVVVYDNIQHTTTFTLPKNHPKRIFYYCWEHEQMGVHELTFANPDALEDDMQATESIPFLVRPEGPVGLRIRGVYAKEESFNNMTLNGDENTTDPPDNETSIEYPHEPGDENTTDPPDNETSIEYPHEPGDENTTDPSGNETSIEYPPQNTTDPSGNETSDNETSIEYPAEPDDDYDHNLAATMLTFTPENTPILVDSSVCPDIVDFLHGSRLVDRPSIVLMQGNLSSGEQGCVVSHAYLDIEVTQSDDRATESAYAQFLYSETQYNAESKIIEEIWTRSMIEASRQYGEHIQLAVLSCNNSVADDDYTHLEVDTDFSFILKDTTKDIRLHAIGCMGAFCMLAIQSNVCMSTEHVALFSPMVTKNLIVFSQVMLQTVAHAGVSIQDFASDTTAVPGITSLNGFAVLYAQQIKESFLCVDIDNTPCTQEKAHSIMRTLWSSRQLVNSQILALHGSNIITVSEMMDAVDTESGIRFESSTMSMTMNGISATAMRYLQGNMVCPENMVSTGKTDTFRYKGANMKIACIFCALNTYYSAKISTPAPVLTQTRIMLVRAHQYSQNDPEIQWGIAPAEANVSQQQEDEQADDMHVIPGTATYRRRLLSDDTDGDTSGGDSPEPAPEPEEHHAFGVQTNYTAYFLVENNADGNNDLQQQIQGEEFELDIGTTLILTLSPPPPPSGGVEGDAYMNTNTMRLVCDGADVPITALDASSFSFYVSSEYAGKAVFVHVVDTAAESAGTVSLPAVFFPRAVKWEVECVACPVGKFGGSAGASDISSCKVVAEVVPMPPDSVTFLLPLYLSLLTSHSCFLSTSLY